MIGGRAIGWITFDEMLCVLPIIEDCLVECKASKCFPAHDHASRQRLKTMTPSILANKPVHAKRLHYCTKAQSS